MLQIEPRVAGVGATLLQQFRRINTSTLGHLTDFGCVLGLQPLCRPVRLLGNAVTVRIPPLDGSAITAAMALVKPGDVLLVDMGDNRQRACWGEFRSRRAMQRQLAGAVINGCVTDYRALVSLDLPVFHTGISALTTRPVVGEANGQVNVPITIGGVCVAPGDLVVGDDDGVFVIKPSQSEALAVAAFKKQQQEEEKCQAFMNY